MKYCSVQHGTLLPSPVTSTAGRFCFGSAWWVEVCNTGSFFTFYIAPSPHTHPLQRAAESMAWIRLWLIVFLLATGVLTQERVV